MLWAIDVGNTHTVVGLYDGAWKAVWRVVTHSGDTEDQLAATFGQLCQQMGFPMVATGVIVGSVVPTINSTWSAFSRKWLDKEAVFLNTGKEVGMIVDYDPPHAVGADRIANALAAIEKYGSPVVVVDFGTATTFDTIGPDGHYMGGAILPGVLISMEALAEKAAKLPSIALDVPKKAIGVNTVEALKSGVMYGYAGSVDAIAGRIVQELGGKARVVSTGGLASAFCELCETVELYDQYLTLDGLVIAFNRLMTAS